MTNTHAKAPTLAAFKQWAKDCQPAAKAVLMARVFAQMERERVDAYILPLFATYQFEVAKKWQERGIDARITKPGDLYLSDDTPMLTAFYADCDAAHRAHGFTGPAGHCPALVAEHLLCNTEAALIALAESLTGIDHVYGDDRAKYLELLIGACLKGGR